jgi:hypothetical protein
VSQVRRNNSIWVLYFGYHGSLVTTQNLDTISSL